VFRRAKLLRPNFPRLSFECSASLPHPSITYLSGATKDMKTQGVYDLSKDVLVTVPTPYGTDIIEDVFVAIEADRDLSSRYQQLVSTLGRDVTNNWIGRHVKGITGMNSVQQVPARRSKSITSYTKLEP
jgi:hypothetical protein